jgi:aromatic-L-amino-acid decarboxylase
MVTTPVQQGLGSGRSDALEHGVALLRDAWRSFDAPRPYQPPVTLHTRDLADEVLPEAGIGPTAALDDAVGVLDQSLSQARPRYFGYIGSSGLEVAALGDALAASHDINLAANSAAADLVERQTVRWVGELVGFPAAAGIFTSGGMLSNLTALSAARERAMPGSRIEGTRGRGLVYASTEAHSSIERAVEVLGMGRRALRAVPIDADRRMRADALVEMIAADRAAGRTPMAVVATAGTTLTGAVDPIRAVSEVCQEFGVWLHVDGAYGLPAACVPAAARLFDGLDQADSAALDAHKWLFVPKACGVLMVRDRHDLQAAFTHDKTYMLDEDGVTNPVDWTLEYSRPFRALKLWLALRAYGANAFRAAIGANLAAAQVLAERVRGHADLELLVPPSLSIVCFRRIPAAGDIDAHNVRLVRELQADGRVFVTSAVVDGRVCLRPCVVNFRTTLDDVHGLIDVVREIGSALDKHDLGAHR